jgi:TRAP transporter TAXI family solute receptor
MSKVLAKVFILCAMVAGGAAAQPATDNGPINVTITGVGVEGYYKVLVETMSTILRDSYPGSAVTFKPTSPGGGLQMVAEGKADISLAAGSPEIEAALAGAPPFPAPLKGKFSWLMQVHDKQYFMFIASKAWADKYGVKSFDDIARKKPPLRIAINRQGNLQIVAVAEDIFRAHGFSTDDLRKWGGGPSWVASNVGLDQLADGKVDMFVNVRFVPDSVISHIASSRDLVWIQADKDKLEQVGRKWSYQVISIPSSSYSFLQDDAWTIKQWSNAVIGNQVPENVAYKVVKALGHHADRMRVVHPSLKDFSAATMAQVDTRLLPIAPGALRFYREAGALK